MHTQNLLAAAHVRQAHHNAAVKPARSQQCRVQNIGPVRRSHQNYAVIRFKAVHLHQQLVQRLLALIVPAAQPCAAMAAHGVDFVNEDDARRVLLALLKQIADAAGAHADEHLNKIGA